jgi:hypothetical protein
VRREWLWLALILAVHAALALWGAARNSVTFDENYHLPSGVLIVAQRDFDVSVQNPPLVKALCAVPTLALGARLPDAAAIANGTQEVVGESFMRRNAARYHTLFFAARCVIVLLSLALGWLVWKYARRLYGPRAALLAAAVYAFLPEALAHAGVATLDLATGLAFLASSYTFWKFLRTGRWRDWTWAALAFGLAFLARSSTGLLLPGFLLLCVLGTALRSIRRPGRAWLGLALLLPAALVIVNLGYLGRTSFVPLGAPLFESDQLQRLGKLWPHLRLPLPDAFISGLDHQLAEARPERVATYLLGHGYRRTFWYYYPVAALVKWPLGFWGLLVTRAVQRLRTRPGRRRAWNETCLLLPALIFTGYVVFFAGLDVGIRYLFPLLPPLCIWVGGLLARPRPITAQRRLRSAWAAAAVALALVQAVEAAACAPWYLSFFNQLAGGPGRGYRIVNDSNVDWGQGLLALKDELKRRGIEKVHLAYHGTTDPAVYGIDYLPYLGGPPGPESDWLAVSSYFYVGLGQHMMTTQGRTRALVVDLRPLWGRPPEATPAGCMFLYRVR